LQTVCRKPDKSYPIPLFQIQFSDVVVIGKQLRMTSPADGNVELIFRAVSEICLKFVQIPEPKEILAESDHRRW
jgi:hypothetical protein